MVKLRKKAANETAKVRRARAAPKAAADAKRRAKAAPNNSHEIAYPHGFTSAWGCVIGLREGQLDPKKLGRRARRECAGILYAEGELMYQIAHILGKSRETVSRDIKIQAAAWADDLERLKPERLIADLMRRAAGLAKACTDKGNPKAAWDIIDSCASRLQSMGFVPERPKNVNIALNQVRGYAERIAAVIRRHVEDPNKLSAIVSELGLGED